MALTKLLHVAVLWVFLRSPSGDSSHAVSAQNRNEILKDPIIYYSTTELACADGYPVQEHKVVTEDGFVLTVHRIPGGRTRPTIPHSNNHYHKIHLNHHPDFDDCVRESLNVTARGPPVLFVHGILMASDGWLLQGPGYDFAYLMADEGYDVWLANVRGNFYSRKHKTMRTSDPKFWDFSFHEHATYDISAVIDYILMLTKREKLGYVGFSMGTSIFFTLASTRPEYNEKIFGFVGMAPIAYIKQQNMTSRRRVLIDLLLRIVEDLEKRGYVHELFPKRTRWLRIGKNYCSKGSSLQGVCYDLVALVMGYHSRLVLGHKFHLYLTHIPAGTSLKTASHYEQNLRSGSFRYFNHGAAKNMKIYGRPIPPDYPVWNITVPVALYYAGGDLFYDVKDIHQLMEYLPNVVDAELTEKFNHADYLWSYKAKDLVYRRAMSVLQRLQRQENRPKKSKNPLTA